MEIESLRTLLKAVIDYREDLETNKQILLNAANVCDVAMGSDEISQKQIARLYEALEDLDKVSLIAFDVAETVMRHIQQVEIIRTT